MSNYISFLEKIIEDYNKKHNIIIPNSYAYSVAVFFNYLYKKYYKEIFIEDLYIRLFDTYQNFILDISTNSAKDYLLILQEIHHVLGDNFHG